MANIASRTFVLAPTTDKYITLAGEEYLRKMAISNNWTSLRIGIMFAINPDGTNNLASPRLQIGVCTADPTTFANTLGFTAATTTNYIGADLFCPGDTGTPETAVYLANSGNPYYSQANGTFGVATGSRRRVGTTNTFGIIGGNSLRAIPTTTGASLQRRGIVYVDITKGSPNYSLSVYSLQSVSMNRDFSLAHFITGFETPTPQVDNVTMSPAQTGSLACSEVAGIFDTVSLYWNRASFPMEVYALAARRMS